VGFVSLNNVCPTTWRHRSVGPKISGQNSRIPLTTDPDFGPVGFPKELRQVHPSFRALHPSHSLFIPSSPEFSHLSNMKPSSLFLALPTLALAADQVPLADRIKGWFDKATSLIPTAIPTPSVLANPLDAGAAKVAELLVHPLNNSNWKDVLEPAAPRIDGLASEWLVYVYGQDSCRSGCKNATKAWNVSNKVLFCCVLTRLTECRCPLQSWPHPPTLPLSHP
jgi:hypothetical protein